MLIEFVLNNAFMTGAVVLLGCATVYLWTRTEQGVAIDPYGVVQKINQQNARVVDVRSAKEFAQGKIVGSQNMLVGELEKKAKELAAKHPLVLVCANGTQSLTAARKLRAAGCEDVSALRGGIRAWLEANQPTLRS